MQKRKILRIRKFKARLLDQRHALSLGEKIKQHIVKLLRCERKIKRYKTDKVEIVATYVGINAAFGNRAKKGI